MHPCVVFAGVCFRDQSAAAHARAQRHTLDMALIRILYWRKTKPLTRDARAAAASADLFRAAVLAQQLDSTVLREGDCRARVD